MCVRVEPVLRKSGKMDLTAIGKRHEFLANRRVYFPSKWTENSVVGRCTTKQKKDNELPHATSFDKTQCPLVTNAGRVDDIPCFMCLITDWSTIVDYEPDGIGVSSQRTAESELKVRRVADMEREIDVQELSHGKNYHTRRCCSHDCIGDYFVFDDGHYIGSAGWNCRGTEANLICFPK